MNLENFNPIELFVNDYLDGGTISLTHTIFAGIAGGFMILDLYDSLPALFYVLMWAALGICIYGVYSLNSHEFKDANAYSKNLKWHKDIILAALSRMSIEFDKPMMSNNPITFIFILFPIVALFNGSYITFVVSAIYAYQTYCFNLKLKIFIEDSIKILTVKG